MLRNTVLILCAVATAASAQVFTVSRDDDNLRQIDPNTGATLTSTPLTGGAGVGFNGMAADPSTGTIYVVVDDPSFIARSLATLNIGTLTVTVVGSMGDLVAGIAFDSSGNLFAVTGDGAASPDGFFSVNKTTGAMTSIGAFGNGTDGETMGSDAAGLVYHASGGFSSAVFFELVNTTNGSVTNIPLSGFTGSCEYTAVNASSAGGFLATTRGLDELLTITSAGFVTLVGTLDHTAKGILDTAVNVMPCDGLYPGTGEDFVLRAGVNGALSICSQTPAVPGDVLGVEISSPSGTFNTVPPVITGQLFATGTTAPFIPVLPPDGIWVNPGVSPGPFILFDGNTPPFNGLGLPPQGLVFQYFVGPGLTGVSAMLNAFTITPLAANNVFAATEGIEIQFM